MNIEKFLQEWAEKDSEALITEEDRLFSQQLAEQAVKKYKEENEKKKEAKRKKKKKYCSD